MAGMGHIGFYKLQIKFGCPMEFVTKLKLNLHPQPTAAACVDHALDYFMRSKQQY